MNTILICTLISHNIRAKLKNIQIFDSYEYDLITLPDLKIFKY